jgi:hypothetical protein
MEETIKQILMRRDEMTSQEADDLIEEAKGALQDYLAAGDVEGAEDICQEYFGLEPDYIFELM